MASRNLIEEMNRYYDRRASWHDRYMGYESNAQMEELFGSIISQLEEYFRGRSVLEIACGTGNWTEVLAKRAKSVHAIDISQTALHLAREKTAALKNIFYVVGNAYSLDGIKKEFNTAFAADWWSHIPRSMTHPFVEKLADKLLPGSKVIFIDMTVSHGFEDEPFFLDEEGNRIYKRQLPDGSEFHVVKNFPSEKELREILGHSGRNLEYVEFAILKRWMVIYDTI